MSVTARPHLLRIDVPAWAHRSGTIVRVAIGDALSLDAASLRSSVRAAYREAFDAADHRHVVRAWNVIPKITAPLGNGDRYMAFNAGRADAMRERFGDTLSAKVPAASGVGGGGNTITIDVLATESPGEPLENPRQTPAFRYSSKFGALPPCFARATRVSLRVGPRLLVAGTAAIVGEDSQYLGDARRQLDSTIDNLRALLTADGGDDSLDRFESVRAYVPRRTFGDAALRQAITDVFGRARIECVQAELCRRELLVEIEGVAGPAGWRFGASI